MPALGLELPQSRVLPPFKRLPVLVEIHPARNPSENVHWNQRSFEKPTNIQHESAADGDDGVLDSALY